LPITFFANLISLLTNLIVAVISLPSALVTCLDTPSPSLDTLVTALLTVVAELINLLTKLITLNTSLLNPLVTSPATLFPSLNTLVTSLSTLITTLDSLVAFLGTFLISLNTGLISTTESIKMATGPSDVTANIGNEHSTSEFELPPAKRQRTSTPSPDARKASSSNVRLSPSRERMQRTFGVAAIKVEFLVEHAKARKGISDDEAESKGVENKSVEVKSGTNISEGSGTQPVSQGNNRRQGKAKKERGQNKGRTYGKWGDKIPLCNSRATSDEFSPAQCRFGDNCRLEHNLRKYLAEGKAGANLMTFDGKCPVWEIHGLCPDGWKCRFSDAHSKEVTRSDGRKELVLITNTDPEFFEAGKPETTPVAIPATTAAATAVRADKSGIFNTMSPETRIDLNRKRAPLAKSVQYGKWTAELGQAEARLQERREAEKNWANMSSAQKSVAAKWGAVATKSSDDDYEQKQRMIEKLMLEQAASVVTASPAPALEAASASVQAPTGLKNRAAVVMMVASEEEEKEEEAKNVDKIAKSTEDKTTEVAPEETAAVDAAAKEKDLEEMAKEATKEAERELQALYKNPPLRLSEKRRLYYGREIPVLAPLTTQGNLPFRQLCVGLGAQATFSEMAMGLPLINGEKGEVALMRAHKTEIEPPLMSPIAQSPPGYDNAKDMKFGAQIAAAKPWIAAKATEVIADYCPNTRVVDLNCGCPIDLVVKSGAGSALLDMPAKLEKTLRAMNAVSGEIPISCKLRTGTWDNKPPTAQSIINRLIHGGPDARKNGLGPAGVAAITLHGRTRQQRYTKSADWSYIAEVQAAIKRYNEELAAETDTAFGIDARDLPNGGKVYFLGNGDIYSHVDYHQHIDEAKVDSAMIGRGALIKPWIFEEIQSGQYLDKRSSERLEYIKQFVSNGLNYWGSDEVGVGTTRRFLLEWLSFTCRYIPVGILEVLPPKLNERAPAYFGRDDMETLMASNNYRDWIKISEMFLGPAHEDFKFVPKHKSNAYETEG